MQRVRCYEAAVFARVFADHDGVQIPGETGNESMRQRLARQLLRAVESGRVASDDVTLLREIKRVRAEVRWARSADSDKVVGFHLTLGPTTETIGACRELLMQDHGLGAAVFPKEQVVVLPPACMDYEFVPVLEDEIEQ